MEIEKSYTMLKNVMQVLCGILIIGIVGTTEYESLSGYTGPQTPLATIFFRMFEVAIFYMVVMNLALFLKKRAVCAQRN